MAEETTAVGTEAPAPETSGGPSPDSSGGDFGQMQDKMEGDFFFDDGLNAVVDKDGTPQYRDGRVIRSLDEMKTPLQKQSAPQPPKAKPGEPAPKQGQQQPAPKQVQNAFESIFSKDGNLDIGAIDSQSSIFGNAPYQSSLYPKNQQEGVQRQPDQPADPKTVMEQKLAEYEQTIHDDLLGPIENVFESMKALHAQNGTRMTTEEYDAINGVYVKVAEKVNKMKLEKRDELRDAMYKEELEKRDLSDMDRIGRDHFTQLAGEYFPKSDPKTRFDTLSQLIFGHKAIDGKFVRGYGSDYVDFLFDRANEGKKFGTPEEWSKAYATWWTKFASNPDNIRHVVKTAWNNYLAANKENIRNGWRAKWDEEQKQKSRQTTQQPKAAMGGNGSAGDDVDTQLKNFFKMPK